jgi:hypothetical protein
MFHTDVAIIYMDVAYVCSGFQVFLGVLHVFQTNVASVSTISDICCKSTDLVLHMLQWDPPMQPPSAAVVAPPSGRIRFHVHAHGKWMGHDRALPACGRAARTTSKR